MPNWFDNLTNPVIPKRAIAGLQNAFAPGSGEAEVQGGLLDVPDALGDIAGNLGEYPQEMLGGFASGALEGLRGLSSPVNMAGALPWGKVAKPLLGAARSLRTPSLSVVDDVPVPQSMPAMSEVDDLISQLGSNLDTIPSGRQAPVRLPEFTPVGGESAFNAAQNASNVAVPKMPSGVRHDPIMDALNRWRDEMGANGVADLKRTPIPRRQVEAPPRDRK